MAALLNMTLIILSSSWMTQLWWASYRGEAEQLALWCQENNLSLNVDKTKEMTIDFRKDSRYAHLLTSLAVYELCISIIEADTIHILMHCQRSDTLKIHMKQLPMRHNTIHHYCDAVRFHMIWFNTMRFNAIWCDLTTRKNVMLCSSVWFDFTPAVLKQTANHELTKKVPFLIHIFVSLVSNRHFHKSFVVQKKSLTKDQIQPGLGRARPSFLLSLSRYKSVTP